MINFWELVFILSQMGMVLLLEFRIFNYLDHKFLYLILFQYCKLLDTKDFWQYYWNLFKKFDLFLNMICYINHPIQLLVTMLLYTRFLHQTPDSNLVNYFKTILLQIAHKYLLKLVVLSICSLWNKYLLTF